MFNQSQFCNILINIIFIGSDNRPSAALASQETEFQGTWSCFLLCMADFHLKTKREFLVSFWISASQQAANKVFSLVTQSPVSAALGSLQSGTQQLVQGLFPQYPCQHPGSKSGHIPIGKAIYGNSQHDSLCNKLSANFNGRSHYLVYQ